MATSGDTAKVEDGGATSADDGNAAAGKVTDAGQETCGKDGDVDVDLATKFAAYCDIKTKDHFTSKACNKLVKDCFEEHFKFKKVILTNRIDSSVFSKCKEKGKQYMVVTPGNCEQFLRYTAFEFGKLKKADDKLSKEDPVVADMYGQLVNKVAQSKGPIIKQVKQSATGNVKGLTDTKKYTGSHKLRFDESGKGRGKAGRVDEKNTSGYVADYKQEGTYDEARQEGTGEGKEEETK